MTIRKHTRIFKQEGSTFLQIPSFWLGYSRPSATRARHFAGTTEDEPRSERNSNVRKPRLRAARAALKTTCQIPSPVFSVRQSHKVQQQLVGFAPNVLGQKKEEGAPFSLFTFCPDSPLMILDDVLRDG